MSAGVGHRQVHTGEGAQAWECSVYGAAEISLPGHVVGKPRPAVDQAVSASTAPDGSRAADRAPSGAVDAEFVAFASAAAPRLRRTAYLMCRDWHLAQDFTQTALAKMYTAWRRVSRFDNLEAYSRKVLLRVVLDHRRRLSARELPIAGPREDGDPARSARPELRVTMIDALGCLPPRDRAIVVLRYWEDQSVETVAETLGVSVSVVKTQSRRSLARLRELLGDSRADLLAEDS
ncbi:MULTISPECIES: SigE family RNA polymerase sigma factor [unclassified Solwaraspora]|uniref:SigE family RNA polymerase sigma factor n=1 Tax=unclassified Solwaraspora TaxID=2627926 RepID=UPI00248B1EF4|nr:MULTISPECIES: SigE family RNA polymerase sigma factor [unclassified Solwaraspora]WBB96890.1 SigE family RNA polymerase sigma factor [Solwaraspora sp. WMMA2059]WBC19205.1 SigE family RNA polymerase sigma factor [Solwaraspora sp. WMMA2080]WJK33380.1 SigE family RNA polymerase sigma factor [Solwaraspora sp. WMMA2065]